MLGRSTKRRVAAAPCRNSRPPKSLLAEARTLVWKTTRPESKLRGLKCVDIREAFGQGAILLLRPPCARLASEPPTSPAPLWWRLQCVTDARKLRSCTVYTVTPILLPRSRNWGSHGNPRRRPPPQSGGVLVAAYQLLPLSQAGTQRRQHQVAAARGVSGPWAFHCISHGCQSGRGLRQHATGRCRRRNRSQLLLAGLQRICCQLQHSGHFIELGLQAARSRRPQTCSNRGSNIQ